MTSQFVPLRCHLDAGAPDSGQRGEFTSWVSHRKLGRERRGQLPYLSSLCFLESADRAPSPRGGPVPRHVAGAGGHGVSGGSLSLLLGHVPVCVRMTEIIS